MTPNERMILKRLIAHMRALNRSEASCYCGRRYMLNFDSELAEQIDVAEAIIDNLPVTWLEVD